MPRVNKLLLKKKVLIDVQQDSALKLQIRDNRLKLLLMIETLMCCGRQNISLRGHRDSGDFKEPIENNRNLLALLRSRILSDDSS